MANEELSVDKTDQVLEARQLLQNKLEEEQRRQAKEIAAIIHAEALDILAVAHSHNGRVTYMDSSVAPEKVLESVRYALRDFDRLELDQKQEFSLTKFVGYLGFWFAKLKPLANIQLLDAGTDPETRDILDINEKIVFELMRRLMLRMTRKAPHIMPKEWSDCTIEACGRVGKCFFLKFTAYLAALDGRYNEYLYYTLRYRPSSPYLLVAILDQAMHFACEVACPPRFIIPSVQSVA
jgi:hypothetical protein